MYYIKKYYFPDAVIGAQLKLDGSDATKTMAQFKKEIKDAETNLLNVSKQFGATSEQAFAAAKNVALLKDNLGDAKKLVDAFNPDEKFRALGQSLQGVLGGFTAITGALGLMGIESDNVQKQLLKVQSALALSQGLNQVGDAIQSFKNLGAIIGNYVVKAFSSLKAALISSGIGALVVALGVVVANFDKIKEAIFGVNVAAKSAAESSAKSADAEQKKLDAIGEQDNILKLQGKTEAQILKIKIAQTDEIITAREQQLIAQQELEASQLAAAKRNHDILRGIIDFITKPIQAILSVGAKVADFFGLTSGATDAVKKINEGVTDKLTNFFIDPAEVKADGDAAIQAIKDQILRLKNERAGFTLALREKSGKPGEKDIDIGTRAKNDPEVLVEVEKSKLIIGIHDTTQRAITDIEKANAIQREYIAKKEAEAKVATAQFVADTLETLASVAGKQTAAGKVLAIASATINTYLAASKALAGSYEVYGPAAPFVRIATVASTILLGLKQVKEIIKVPVPGGGGGGSAPSASGLSGGVSAPLSTSAGFTNTRLDANQLNQIGNATVRAFVVESDVTNNQERVRRLNRSARI